MNNIEKKDEWVHNRFQKGDAVRTEFGAGVIVGIDLPNSRAWRWVVMITDPIKSHSEIEAGRPMAFVDREVEKEISI